MGITIHYRFVFTGTPEFLLREVETLATKLGMEVRHRSWNHLLLHPAPNCETLDLHWHKWKMVRNGDASTHGCNLWYERETLEGVKAEISDNDWVCSGFTKTHYAGVECHVAVAELLRFIASRCKLVNIHDEADYYERGGKAAIETAERHFDQLNAMMGHVADQLKAAFGARNVITGFDLTREREEARA